MVSHISGHPAPVDMGHPAGILLCRQVVEHEAVKAPEERSEGFAGAGGGEDQGTLAARDDRPAHALRGGGRIEDGLEPLRRDGVEEGEWVSGCVRVVWVRGHA
jgi:hypothetical protein